MTVPVALTIGNFDGVHRAHQSLLAEARRRIGAGGRVVAVTFEPPPAEILRPGVRRPRLTRPEQRDARLRESGADDVLVIEATPALLAEAPEAFVRRLVVDQRATVIVEGPDFRFGRDRGGTVETLRALEASLGHVTVVIDPVDVPLSDMHLVRASSTIARWLISRGRVTDAARVLGRPHTLRAEVISGDKRGRELGVPTANLGPTPQLLPADGIYAGRARRLDGGAWFAAATSVGNKPTFGGLARVCETHLVGYDGPVDDYGWTIELEVSSWLRDQVRFPGVEALVDQLRRDVARAATRGAAAPEASVAGVA